MGSEMCIRDRAIDIGDTVTLSAIILPEDVDNPSITWSSSNPDVISIDNGKLKH